MSSIIKFTLKELKELTSDDKSSVHVKTVVQNIALPPWGLTNLKQSVTKILDCKIGKHDRELDGIIISYKNVKMLNDLGTIRNDCAEIYSDIQVDLYAFRPQVGTILRGVINKKSVTHLGVLVHRLFNVVIPKPSDLPWVGSQLSVGQTIFFEIVVVDLFGALPYIRGSLDESLLPPLVEDDIDNNCSDEERLKVTHVNFDGIKPQIVYNALNSPTSFREKDAKTRSSANTKTVKVKLMNKTEILTPVQSPAAIMQEEINKNKKKLRREVSESDSISDVDDEIIIARSNIIKKIMEQERSLTTIEKVKIGEPNKSEGNFTETPSHGAHKMKPKVSPASTIASSLELEIKKLARDRLSHVSPLTKSSHESINMKSNSDIKGEIIKRNNYGSPSESSSKVNKSRSKATTISRRIIYDNSDSGEKSDVQKIQTKQVYEDSLEMYNKIISPSSNQNETVKYSKSDVPEYIYSHEGGDVSKIKPRLTKNLPLMLKTVHNSKIRDEMKKESDSDLSSEEETHAKNIAMCQINNDSFFTGNNSSRGSSGDNEAKNMSNSVVKKTVSSNLGSKVAIEKTAKGKLNSISSSPKNIKSVSNLLSLKNDVTSSGSESSEDMFEKTNSIRSNLNNSMKQPVLPNYSKSPIRTSSGLNKSDTSDSEDERDMVPKERLNVSVSLSKNINSVNKSPNRHKFKYSNDSDTPERSSNEVKNKSKRSSHVQSNQKNILNTRKSLTTGSSSNSFSPTEENSKFSSYSSAEKFGTKISDSDSGRVKVNLSNSKSEQSKFTKTKSDNVAKSDTYESIPRRHKYKNVSNEDFENTDKSTLKYNKSSSVNRIETNVKSFISMTDKELTPDSNNKKKKKHKHKGTVGEFEQVDEQNKKNVLVNNKEKLTPNTKHHKQTSELLESFIDEDKNYTLNTNNSKKGNQFTDLPKKKVKADAKHKVSTSNEMEYYRTPDVCPNIKKNVQNSLSVSSLEISSPVPVENKKYTGANEYGYKKSCKTLLDTSRSIEPDLDKPKNKRKSKEISTDTKYSEGEVTKSKKRKRSQVETDDEATIVSKKPKKNKLEKTDNLQDTENGDDISSSQYLTYLDSDPILKKQIQLLIKQQLNKKCLN